MAKSDFYFPESENYWTSDKWKDRSITVKYFYYHTDLKTRCKQSLVFNYKEEILCGCSEIIEKYDAEALRIYMEEFETPLALQTLQEEFERFIIYQGISDQKAFMDIIHEEPEIYVEKLLKLFRRIKNMVEFCNNDPRLIAPMRKAFETIVDTTRYFSLELCIQLFSTNVIKNNSSQKWSRKYESRCPEFLAHYCNILLGRNAFLKFSNEEIESKLKDVISFLAYVKNKDVFMASYKALLTRRLLHWSSFDNFREMDAVIWMRNSGMPLDYINELLTIFQDVEFSEVFTAQFKDYYQLDTSIPDLLDVTILNCDASSMDREQSLVSLPQELQTIVSKVDYFYNQVQNSSDALRQRKNRRRHLEWYHHLSYGRVIFRNATGKFELDVTAYQMIVLLVWNRRRLQFKFKELEEITKLPQKELRKTLWSLVAFPELDYQVLLYLPMVNSEKDFNDNTLFWVNKDFCIVKQRKTCTRGKVNLIGRHLLFSEKCKEVESEKLVHQRTMRTRRAILQIMRVRDVSYTVPLHMELVGILKNEFTPPSLLVKDQIEWLIQMHSLTRDEKHKRLICYQYPILKNH